MLEKFKEDMPLKEPLYRIDKDFSGDVFLNICNQYGEHVVYPQSPGAKHRLLYLGYRIDFGEWDYNGRLIRFKEDLEENEDIKHLLVIPEE